MEHKALVLGANYYIGLSAIRCLGREGVQVVAVDYQQDYIYGFSSKYLSEALIGPHYGQDPKGLLDFLLTYGRKQEAKPVLMPCADPYVEFIEAYRDDLQEVFLLPGMRKGLQLDLLEKDSLTALCKEHGVKTPEILQPSEDHFMDRVVEEIGFPCLLKPANSHKFVATFRKKMFRCHNLEELKEALAAAQREKLEVFVQRIIPGFDDHMYTYDAHLNEESEVTHWTTCQKQRQYPINFGASVYTRQLAVPELHEIGARFLKGIGYKGFAEIEFKKDEKTGDFYLIEVNVRYSNLNHLLYMVGLNMPYITYRELIGHPLPEKVIRHNTGLYFWYAYEDLLAVRTYIKEKQLSLGQVLTSYFHRKAPAIWWRKDPKPYFTFMAMLLKKIRKRRRAS